MEWVWLIYEVLLHVSFQIQYRLHSIEPTYLENSRTYIPGVQWNLYTWSTVEPIYLEYSGTYIPGVQWNL